MLSTVSLQYHSLYQQHQCLPCVASLFSARLLFIFNMAERRVDKDLRRPMRDDGLPDIRGPGDLPDVKLTITEGTDPSVATFLWSDEGHTLGNCLRHVLMSNDQTSFCGYTIPHPLEPKMKMHLRTVREDDVAAPACEVLKTGLAELSGVMQHTLHLFDEALVEYEKTSAMDTE